MENINLKVGNETLAGVIIRNNNNIPNFVFLHGAGTGNKERVNAFVSPLMDKGISLLTFDFSGHGESSGKLEQSSMAKRVLEAKTFIETLTDTANLTICGSSMGSYIALKMLEYFPIKTLILICPAIYDKKVYDMPFNQEFTKAIRQPKSWRNSDVLANLEKFQGKLLIIIGERDEVIPPAL